MAGAGSTSHHTSITFKTCSSCRLRSTTQACQLPPPPRPSCAASAAATCMSTLLTQHIIACSLCVPLSRVRLLNDGLWPFTEFAARLVRIPCHVTFTTPPQGVEFLMDIAVAEACAFLRTGDLPDGMRWTTWRDGSPVPIEVMMQQRTPPPSDAVLLRRAQPPSSVRVESCTWMIVDSSSCGHGGRTAGSKRARCSRRFATQFCFVANDGSAETYACGRRPGRARARASRTGKR